MGTRLAVPSRRWLGLAAIATAQFMVIMDTSIIGVALPDMQRDLGFSADGLTWVFNAYVVAFGGLLLAGGKLSDLFGARRMFITGWAVLAVGSLAAGVAPNPATELVGRAVQGTGSALIAPVALAMLTALFAPRPPEPTKALACMAPQRRLEGPLACSWAESSPSTPPGLGCSSSIFRSPRSSWRWVPRAFRALR